MPLHGLSALLVVLLVVLLALAVASDLRDRRIPNILTLGGAAAAVCWHSVTGGADATLQALLGWLVGLAPLMVIYLLGGMGAGDVKLMGMVGAFLGPFQVAVAALLGLLAGGVMALAVAVLPALREGMAGGGAFSLREARKTRFPYALAIAAGTLLAMWNVANI